MNSYTLTSKKIKRNILISFIILIVNFIFIDLCLYLYSDFKTTKNTFVEEKKSKIKHFNLNKELNRDYIFIGSSRTIYHISTEIFKKNNFNIYNFGVSGNFLLDYPSFVSEAIKQKPKNIVISLPKEVFFKEIDIPKAPLLEDLNFFYKINENQILLRLFFNWLENLHLFFTYSETIFLKIIGFYNIFDIKPENVKGNINPTMNLDHNQMKFDCNVFSILNINKKQIIKCTNGDGVLIGNKKISDSRVKKDKKYILNIKAIYIINNLIYKIKNVGLNPIIILEPSYNMQELQNIEYLINSKILNFSNLTVNEKFWVDETHLNSLGRELYSNILIKELTNVNK